METPDREPLNDKDFITWLHKNYDGITIVPGELGDNAGVIGNSMWAEKCLGEQTTPDFKTR